MIAPEASFKQLTRWEDDQLTVCQLAEADEFRTRHELTLTRPEQGEVGLSIYRALGFAGCAPLRDHLQVKLPSDKLAEAIAQAQMRQAWGVVGDDGWVWLWPLRRQELVWVRLETRRPELQPVLGMLCNSVGLHHLAVWLSWHASLKPAARLSP